MVTSLQGNTTISSDVGSETKLHFLEKIPTQDYFSSFLKCCNVPITFGELGVSLADINNFVGHEFHTDQFNNMIHYLPKSQVTHIYTETL